jgi:hypothetical protein
MTYLIFITIVFSFEIFLIHFKLNGTHHQHKKTNWMREFLWMNEYPHKHSGCKASSFGIGNQSINQFLRYSNRAKGPWWDYNGKRDLTRRWRYQWKHWFHPGQRGLGELGPDTKHNLSSICAQQHHYNKEDHLGPQQTNPP